MRRFTSVAAGLGIAATTVAGISLAAAGSTDAPAAAQRAVVLADGDDRLPSGSATDWVTYADHVVVVNATSETALPPTRTEIERGEGLIGRKVDLEVQKVLWSRKDAAQPAPRSWEYNATGWVFADGKPETRTALALHDRPRIETGHQYVLAIAWQAPQCATGDTAVPGRWMGLGSGSELPFDGGVIGQGENEGQLQTVDQVRSEAADNGLEDALAGQGATQLIAQLRAAQPVERRLPSASSTCR
ncbi:hypothetical protein [Kribbella sp. CA-247076]|uniref:hypothetical protein n=1 Tax=Kribbella sp. CA-247076 TaxID=3239941 RepID=UPI003D8BF843